jgi:hypothetical protein
MSSTMWLANKMDIPSACGLNLNASFSEKMYMALFAGCT